MIGTELLSIVIQCPNCPQWMIRRANSIICQRLTVTDQNHIATSRIFALAIIVSLLATGIAAGYALVNINQSLVPASKALQAASSSTPSYSSSGLSSSSSSSSSTTASQQATFASGENIQVGSTCVATHANGGNSSSSAANSSSSSSTTCYCYEPTLSSQDSGNLTVSHICFTAVITIEYSNATLQGSNWHGEINVTYPNGIAQFSGNQSLTNGTISFSFAETADFPTNGTFNVIVQLHQDNSSNGFVATGQFQMQQVVVPCRNGQWETRAMRNRSSESGAFVRISRWKKGFENNSIEPRILHWLLTAQIVKTIQGHVEATW